MVQQPIRWQLLRESGVAEQVRQQHSCFDLDPVTPSNSTRQAPLGWPIAEVRSKKALGRAAHRSRFQPCGKEGAQLLNECHVLRLEALEPIGCEGGSLDRAVSIRNGDGQVVCAACGRQLEEHRVVVYGIEIPQRAAKSSACLDDMLEGAARV